MATQERTETPLGTSFTVASIDGKKYGKRGKLSPQDIINLGNAISLDGWWLAGTECVRSFGGNASAYARVAAGESKRKSGDGVPYSENTIRQFVSYVVRALGQGDKRDKYTGIDHLRATMTQTSTKKGKVVEPSGKRVVSASTRKIYEALMKTAEFRALPADEKALIRKLSKGEAFHTNIG